MTPNQNRFNRGLRGNAQLGLSASGGERKDEDRIGGGENFEAYRVLDHAYLNRRGREERGELQAFSSFSQRPRLFLSVLGDLGGSDKRIPCGGKFNSTEIGLSTRICVIRGCPFVFSQFDNLRGTKRNLRLVMKRNRGTRQARICSGPVIFPPVRISSVPLRFEDFSAEAGSFWEIAIRHQFFTLP